MTFNRTGFTAPGVFTSSGLETSLINGSTVAAPSTDYTDIIKTLEDSAAQQQIDIITLAAAASVTPLTPSNTVADTFKTSGGYLSTVVSATAAFNVNKYENEASTIAFAPTPTGTYFNIGCNSGTIRQIAQQFVLTGTTTITAVYLFTNGLTGTPGGITCQIQSGNTNPTGSLVDANATKFLATANITTGTNNVFTFASPISMTAGSYFIVGIGSATSGTNTYNVTAGNSGGGIRYYDGTWHSDGIYQLRSGYILAPASGSKNILTTLGNQTGNLIQGLYVKTKSSGGTVNFDYSFDAGSTYTTGNSLNQYIDVGSVTGVGAGSNLLRFQIPEYTNLTTYAAVLFYG